MDLKRAIGRTRTYETEDLNITPVMNIFLILVPFLLLTAVFVKISILEFSLPSKGDKPAQATQAKNPIVTILAITDKGFDLKTKDMKIPHIAKQDNDFDYAGLVEKLSQVKQRHQDTEDIIIAPQAAIKYDIIIKVMDRCRENGFPNISISG